MPLLVEDGSWHNVAEQLLKSHHGELERHTSVRSAVVSQVRGNMELEREWNWMGVAESNWCFRERR
jgi:hypothetical protein